MADATNKHYIIDLLIIKKKKEKVHVLGILFEQLRVNQTISLRRPEESQAEFTPESHNIIAFNTNISVFLKPRSSSNIFKP